MRERERERMLWGTNSCFCDVPTSLPERERERVKKCRGFSITRMFLPLSTSGAFLSALNLYPSLGNGCLVCLCKRHRSDHKQDAMCHKLYQKNK